jgi:hypothetical protein
MVAPPVHPTRQCDSLPDMRAAQFPASICFVHKAASRNIFHTENVDNL